MEPFNPPESVRKIACKALEMRREENRGGTLVGVARARDLCNGKNIPMVTIARMFSYFSRHEVDKKAEGFNKGEKGYPSNGRIAWDLWGGDPGFSWCRKIWSKFKKDSINFR